MGSVETLDPVTRKPTVRLEGQRIRVRQPWNPYQFHRPFMPPEIPKITHQI